MAVARFIWPVIVEKHARHGNTLALGFVTLILELATIGLVLGGTSMRDTSPVLGFAQLLLFPFSAVATRRLFIEQASWFEQHSARAERIELARAQKEAREVAERQMLAARAVRQAEKDEADRVRRKEEQKQEKR